MSLALINDRRFVAFFAALLTSAHFIGMAIGPALA